MEKFQIAKYGMMQVTAIVYGILVCGAMVKLSLYGADPTHVPVGHFLAAVLYRDYGLWLLGLVLLWSAAAGYLISPLSRWDLDAEEVVSSGFGLAIGYALVGTFIAFSAVIANSPVHISNQPSSASASRPTNHAP